MEYLRRHVARPSLVPREHVIVFDEAQRAFDPDMIAEKRSEVIGLSTGKSEPDLVIEIADRVPGWCLVIGLIGTGKEIHLGEEAGIGQWRRAVERSRTPGDWAIHGARGALSPVDWSRVRSAFEGIFPGTRSARWASLQARGGRKRTAGRNGGSGW